MRHRLLIVLIIIGLIAGRSALGTTSYFGDSNQNTGNTFEAWVSNIWVQTTQADFEAGVPNNVDTSSSPGDIMLEIVSSDTVTDTFNDETMIASKTNLDVAGGQVILTISSPSGTETLRPNTVGTYSQCDPVGASFNYQCVYDAVADEDTTYVETRFGATELDMYNF
ncbi:MAG: hypothetical protein JSW16_08500, partial [Dehalococcoidales bacterium]